MILDVMLPVTDGWSLIAELRRAGNQTPVLFLTARDSTEDIVQGLELGADDYLVKPSIYAQLLARVRSRHIREKPGLSARRQRVAAASTF